MKIFKIKFIYICGLIFVLFLPLFVFAEERSPLNNIESPTIGRTFGVGKYYWIIYDNVCPYCQQSSKYIKELDWEGNFKFISYRDPMTYILFPFLTKEECEKDIHMVTPKGKVLVGYEVFRTVIENLTATKYFNPVLKNEYAEKKLIEIYEKMVEKRSCYYEKTKSCQPQEEAPLD